MYMKTSFTVCLLLAIAAPAGAQPVRFMLHGNMSHDLPSEDYLRFVEEARPDILIMGVFDQRLYAMASPGKASKKAPVSPADHLARWKAVADRLHAKGIRLVGQMELFVLTDQPRELDESAGWFGYYEKSWNEKLLGARPAKAFRDLLASSPLAEPLKEDRTALCGCRVNTKAILGCVNNPAWAQVQKRMVKTAIEHGVDGFMTNRNFFEHCNCPHCQEQFRRWLAGRYAAEELKSRFGITNLSTHAFSCVAGTYRIHEVAPDALHLEKLRFTKDRVRQFFQEVYLQYGRSLKKDLFAAQWNHMAYFDELHLDRGHLPTSTRTSLAHALADERWGVPANLWGRSEDLLWYCNWGTTQNTILAKEYAGDTVLYGLYLRAMAQGKPYVINKYDFYRPRVMMAEAAALGYATNAIATPWQHEEDREIVLRYFRFLRTHADLYEKAARVGEIGLVFPRRAIHAGDASALETIETCGRRLVRDHRLFDMVPDDLLAQTSLGGFRTLVVAAPEYLEKDDLHALGKFCENGGTLLWTATAEEDRLRPGAMSPDAKRYLAMPPGLPKGTRRIEGVRTQPEVFAKAIGPASTLSQVKAPWTTEMHAYRQDAKKRWILHLVNYNHNEKAAGKSVSAREAPIATEPAEVRLLLPPDTKVRGIRFLSPDHAKEDRLAFRQADGRVEFIAPSFLAYGVCVVETE